MMEIVNSSSKENIKTVFGLTYCIANNPDTLNDNYNSIISSRVSLLTRIYHFIETSSYNSILSLNERDLNLLKFNTISVDAKYYKSLPLFINYYNLYQLRLFDILNKIIKDKSTITLEDISIMRIFIRNNKIEEILASSIPGYINLDRETLKVLVEISSRNYLTAGHTIHTYENLCHNLNLGTYTNNPRLKYRITS